ncbi:methyltransferase [Erythrobacter arachoides]|uniref:Methyltransferase n=1 Tax=Aurantiacibacter arachoides TaxID=1850444 RepID=A0A844ZXI0_9SPHN|nr:methyltransferase [Aurantiacibacter arachoides]MXO93001.1 methyltransferase [Aurantiacibacter arachoides]GGD52787.1 methyltransferase [Aurantiacibacter arachoides]
MIRFAPVAATVGALLVATAGCATIEQEELGAFEASEELMAAVISPARPAEDVARDAARLPLETISFAGVAPGQTIAEIAPGGGYYTRILAQAVGSEGKVYALMPASFANRPGGLDTINALAEQYGNIEVVVVESYASLTLPEQVDLVWTTENYHDLANGDVAATNRWAYGAVRPGGIYFVEDHAAPGTGTAATATLHRIDPATVRQQVTAAGFRFEAESNHLANPADPHTANPRDFAGESDRFAFRFRR